MTVASSRVETRQLDRTDTATVNTIVSVDEVGPTLQTIFRDVYEYVVGLGLEPEQAIGRYGQMGKEMLIHAGFKTPRPIPGNERIKPGELPGGLAAVCLHVGPHDTVGEAYRKIGEWMIQEGRTPAADPWEVYLSLPNEQPPRTEVVFLLTPRDSDHS